MTARMERNENTLKAFLSGEIDHHNIPAIRDVIDRYIDFASPEELILDFSEVTFMDSSGIGLVMGRYRKIEDKNCTLSVINLSEHAFRVMKLAGLEKIAVLKTKSREVVK